MELSSQLPDTIDYEIRDQDSIIVSFRRRKGSEEIGQVELKYWSSLRSKGWPKEFDELHAPGGKLAFRLDWPVISIRGESTGLERGIFPNRATVRGFERGVGTAILEEMLHLKLVVKDEERRFTTVSGQLVVV